MLIDTVTVESRRPPRRRKQVVIGAVAVLVTALVVGALIIVVLAHRTTAAPESSPALPVSVAMPRGDLPADAYAPDGWKQVFTDDFQTDSTAAADGTLSGNDRWWGYYAGTKITNSSNGVYDPARVVSVSDGSMHFRLHSENGTAYAAVESPTLAPQTYGRYSVRYRYLPGSNVAGFKSVWMLWPDSNRWGDGEIDFNEFDNQANRTSMRSALLQACGVDTGCPQTQGARDLDPTEWHVGTVVWAPGVVRAYVDGHLVAQSTTGVPSTPMHLLLQTEASDYGPTAAPGAEMHIDVDWVTVYSRN